MKRFFLVPAAEAREGMLLHGDLHDRGGNVLLPKGTALTEVMIKSVQRRGFDFLAIVDDSITSEQIAAERLRVQERLAYLFRHTGNDRANLLLREIIEQYRMTELA